VGGTEPVRFNLRLVAATNKNPLDEIKAGHFREDLYYRLNVVGIYLPPLRERKEDIPLLVEHFIRKYNAQMGKNCRGITNEAMDILMSSSWKGNIRELQNVIERAVIFAEGDMITSADIGPIGPGVTAKAAETENLQEILRQREREHLYRILRKYGQNKAAAAKALGVGLSSLYRKMDELGISPEEQSRMRQNEPGATEEQAAS
jgi:transcriptional regulator with PAS, ATPase and Fis domain